MRCAVKEMMGFCTLGIAGVLCAFALGYLVRYAQEHKTQVMGPMRDEKGRFLPWKGLA